MSVLKSKRTTSSMEFVNTANKIYVETINFLSLVSARYARLIAQDVAHLASEVMDYSEKANAILPNTDDRTRPAKGAERHLEAASLHPLQTDGARQAAHHRLPAHHRLTGGKKALQRAFSLHSMDRV